MAIHNITVGIDESATAANAAAWAVGLARCEDAAVQATHVWQSPLGCIHPSIPSTDQQVRHARKLMSDTLDTLGGDRRVASFIVRGAAGPVLTSTSEHADLLVLGRTRQKLVDDKTQSSGGLMAGSTASYCVSHSRGPVAVIPDGASWAEAPQVLIGIDGSPNSLAALRWATKHLPADASIHAMTAVSVPNADLEAELLDPVVDRHRDELRRLVNDNLPETFLTSGRNVQTHVVLGYAQDALTDPGFPCDLIVVGEHGNNVEAPGVLGSIANHTLRYATVPLIVVPGPTVTATSASRISDQLSYQDMR